MSVLNLNATQGGGTSYFCEDQSSQVFVEVPGWGNYKPGDRVPEDWSYVPIGLISIGEVEDMHTTERDGYEAGYAGKTDPNPFIEESYNHRYWKCGHERGVAERLAMDKDVSHPSPNDDANSDANICA